jgi:hypothetical protein
MIAGKRLTPYEPLPTAIAAPLTNRAMARQTDTRAWNEIDLSRPRTKGIVDRVVYPVIDGRAAAAHDNIRRIGHIRSKHGTTRINRAGLSGMQGSQTHHQRNRDRCFCHLDLSKPDFHARYQTEISIKRETFRRRCAADDWFSVRDVIPELKPLIRGLVGQSARIRLMSV